MNTETTVIPAKRQSAVPWITVQDESGQERTITFDTDQLVVGSAADCDVVLDTESVAPHHARVHRTGSQVLVSDLGSQSGSLLDNQPIADTGEQVWSPGTQLQIGRHSLSLTLPDRPAAPAEPTIPLAIQARMILQEQAESSSTAPPSRAETDDTETMPEELKRLNLGAFLITPIWAIGNSSWWLFILSLIPYANLAACFIGLVHGNELAWRHRTWRDAEHFRSAQRGWMIAGVLINIIVVPILVMEMSSGGYYPY